MADDILIRIKEAEEKASNDVADAKETSTQIINDARSKADSEYKRIISEANKKAASLIDEAKESAEDDKQPILQKAREDSNKIRNIDKKNIDNLIKKLTERIVVDGNS